MRAANDDGTSAVEASIIVQGRVGGKVSGERILWAGPKGRI